MTVRDAQGTEPAAIAAVVDLDGKPSSAFCTFVLSDHARFYR